MNAQDRSIGLKVRGDALSDAAQFHAVLRSSTQKVLHGTDTRCSYKKNTLIGVDHPSGFGSAQDASDERGAGKAHGAARCGIGAGSRGRRFRKPPAGADCVPGESERSAGAGRRSADDGTAGRCSIRDSSPTGAGYRSIQTHAGRSEADESSRRNYHIAAVANFAPSTSDRSFAQAIWGCVRPPNPQSAPAITFSFPSSAANR